MTEQKTPNYIKSLLLPSTKAPLGRKAWSIDLETVWIPFFTATNTTGDTAIPHDALGCPLRLAYDKDGSVRFSRNGRPVTRIAKPLSQAVTLVRENFVATLKQHAQGIAEAMPDEYALNIEYQREAGEPILKNDKAEMDKAIRMQVEKQMAEAEAKMEAEKAEAESAKEKELQPA